MRQPIGIALGLMLVASSPALAQSSLSEVVGPAPPQLMLPNATPVQSLPTTPGSTPNLVTPVPDPTKLTTEAVDRAKADLKEVFGIAIAAIVQRLNTLESRSENMPASVREEVRNLRGLMDERFKRVDDAFINRDAALGAALLSNTTAITKSEAGTAKEIDGLKDQLAAGTRSTDEKVAAVRELISSADKSSSALVTALDARLTRLEARQQGSSETRTENRADWGWVFGAIGAIVGVLGIIGAIVAFTRRPSPTPPVEVIRYVEPTNGRQPAPKRA